MREVHHEIAPTWNIKAKPGVDRCRWFDEAFASYFAILALREIEGSAAYIAELEAARGTFLSRAAQHPVNAQTPIADYGKMESSLRVSWPKRLESNRSSKDTDKTSGFCLNRDGRRDRLRRVQNSFLSDSQRRPFLCP